MVIQLLSYLKVRSLSKRSFGKGGQDDFILFESNFNKVSTFLDNDERNISYTKSDMGEAFTGTYVVTDDN